MMSIDLKKISRLKLTPNQRMYELIDNALEVKVVKICVGKHKRPIDKKEEIIFHIDI